MRLARLVAVFTCLTSASKKPSSSWPSAQSRWSDSTAMASEKRALARRAKRKNPAATLSWMAGASSTASSSATTMLTFKGSCCLSGFFSTCIAKAAPLTRCELEASPAPARPNTWCAKANADTNAEAADGAASDNLRPRRYL